MTFLANPASHPDRGQEQRLEVWLKDGYTILQITKGVRTMISIINNLRAFNRKERFFLVGMVLGNTSFRLCKEFRRKISDIFHLDVPEDAFAAMDYHLDWIYASLFVSSNETDTRVYPNVDNLIRANQEDIDFLVAYQDGDACHIILLEAKGVTGFTNRQLQSKVQRLREIFGEEGDKWRGVVPHFAMVSPRKPVRVRSSDWPEWLKPEGMVTWVSMPLPGRLKSITRCDEEGKASARGNYWKVVPN